MTDYDRYAHGFITKCASLGVNPVSASYRLNKEAQFAVAHLISSIAANHKINSDLSNRELAEALTRKPKNKKQKKEDASRKIITVDENARKFLEAHRDTLIKLLEEEE